MTRTYKAWNNDHKEFIRQNAHKMTDKELATKLGRGLSSVRKQRQRLKIKKKSGRGICEVITPTVSEVLDLYPLRYIDDPNTTIENSIKCDKENHIATVENTVLWKEKGNK